MDWLDAILPRGISTDTLIFLCRGLVQTFKLAAVALVCSLTLGVVFGIMRYSGGRALRLAATTFVELFRNTPVLVQILWFYFALPILTGLEVSAFTAAALGLSLNSGAFSAEIVRAGLQGVPRGQWEAAEALGLSRGWRLRRVILPQALRNMLPAFTNRWIELFKLTSLGAIIAYPELVYSAQQVSNTWFNPVEVFSTVAVIFAAIVIPATWGLRRLETRLARKA